LFACNLSVLRIRDVYHWSWILIFFPSRIPKNSNRREGQCCGSIRCLFDPWIRDPEIGFFRITPDLGSWIQNPYFYVLWFFVKTYSGSQIQGSKRRWIPDPGIYTDPVRRDPTLTGSGSTLLFIIVSFHLSVTFFTCLLPVIYSIVPGPCSAESTSASMRRCTPTVDMDTASAFSSKECCLC
jgi:hypothetical protein